MFSDSLGLALILFTIITIARGWSPYSNVSLQDMQALEALYDATNGRNWLWRMGPQNYTNYDSTTTLFGTKWNFTVDSSGYFIHDPCFEKWQGICCAGSLHGQCSQIISISHIETVTLMSKLAENSIKSHVLMSINSQEDVGVAVNTLNSSVIAVVLTAFGLDGYLPTTFFSLTSLAVLSITRNHRLRGTIPAEIGGLHSLEYLDFQNNNFGGQIPWQFGNLSLLSVLSLINNNIEGTIPQQLGALSLLSKLGLSNNVLEGTIPVQLGDLVGLSGLYLDYNVLLGTIPQELGDLSLLSVLTLHNNMLEGNIPSQLGQLTLLSDLFISNNWLDGSIPEQLGRLSLLTQMYLHDNLLDGSIPSFIGNLFSLITLYLDNNCFKGKLPESLGMLSSLQVLTVANNMLSGPLPNQLTTLKSLTTLLLQKNSFTGWPLQALSATQSKLSTVDLSDNSFSGSFPSAMFQFASMQSVSLVSNCFTGSLSSSLCLSSSLQVLALDGLTSGTECKKRLFGALSTVYVVKSYMHGTVPSCLFSMSSLAVLQLSGNGLGGQLPSSTDFSLSSSLHNLSLSHNRLHGAIPVAFQEHDFALLDLSYNKLSGTVDYLGNFFTVSTRNLSKLGNGLPKYYSDHKQLALEVNRLSGTLPSSFAVVGNIQVVLGNLFTCDKQHQLPANDPGTQFVQCGSLELNVALILWLVLWLTLAATGSYFYYYYYYSCYWRIKRSYSLTISGQIRLTDQAIYAAILAATSLVLAYWLIGELLLKYASKQQYATHSFEYAYGPSLAFVASDTPAVWTLISAMAWMSLVHAMLARHQRKLSSCRGDQQKLPVKWQWRRAAVVVLVILVDWLVMALANLGYIYTVIHSNVWISYMAQVTLTAFKLTMNGALLPVALRKISSGEVNQLVLTGLLLCNNLLIPIITIMCAEPNCFSELFLSAPTISSLFVYTQPCSIRVSATDCVGLPTEVQTSYQPPFIYTYQCSSNMLTTYLPVFVMMYTYIGFIQPLIIAGLTVVNFHYKTRWSLMITNAFGCDILMPEGQGNKEKLFNGSQLSVMLTLHTVTLLTFGTAYPLLSVLICTAVCVEAVQWRVLIAYFLQSCAAVTDESKRETMEKRLQKSSEGLLTGDLMYECRWMVMTVMALFFSFFLMDMAGDRAGDDWSKIVWAPVTILLWPMMMNIMESLFLHSHHYHLRNCWKDAAGNGVSEQSDKQLQMVSNPVAVMSDV